ncbi:MAG: hypothetical protein UZ21_OP11001000258 [Microgenomates bacterium OLB22]|nr:MAG: hypothetical protein UZ21_OP11001000258 [Microgenomates bacterium OLB22]
MSSKYGFLTQREVEEVRRRAMQQDARKSTNAYMAKTKSARDTFAAAQAVITDILGDLARTMKLGEYDVIEEAFRVRLQYRSLFTGYVKSLVLIGIPIETPDFLLLAVPDRHGISDINIDVLCKALANATGVKVKLTYDPKFRDYGPNYWVESRIVEGMVFFRNSPIGCTCSEDFPTHSKAL